MASLTALVEGVLDLGSAIFHFLEVVARLTGLWVVGVLVVALYALHLHLINMNGMWEGDGRHFCALRLDDDRSLGWPPLPAPLQRAEKQQAAPEKEMSTGTQLSYLTSLSKICNIIMELRDLVKNFWTIPSATQSL